MLIFFGFLLVLGVQQPSGTSDVEHFTTLERQWMDALAAKDEPTLQRLMAHAFSITGAGSTGDAPVGLRAGGIRLPPSSPFRKFSCSEVRVTSVDDVAIVRFILCGTYPP